MKFDVEYIRNQFPAMSMKVNGYPAAFLDGPGGTQTPQRVIDAMVDYIINYNANIEGVFKTSVESDELLLNSRKALADFLGCSYEEVAFGENTTTNNFKLALAIARDLKPGDEIIITQIDHEANRGPWESLQERGIIVKEVQVDTDTCTIDMEDYKSKLSDKTKVAAFNYASNGVGTISDVKTMSKLAHEVGAITVIDAVHYALHGPIDVKDIDADFLLCSAYKFFGPHIGILYGKKEAFEKIRTYKVRPQYERIPDKIETGTLNHEGMVGAMEAVEFIADIGSKYLNGFKKETEGLTGRRKNIIAGMLALEAYEQPIANYLIEELSKIEKIKIYGPPKGHPRTSTVSFTIDGLNSRDVAKALGEKGLFVWDGDFFATKLVECLGIVEQGGLVRVGLAPYNTIEEIERLIAEVKKIAE
ncbi:MAG TPA: cysteine desulfurase-like protein [Thermoanaerobacterales bacterium]|nr:cysteine desulfurase-like protein [Thermoanaerobacterales bacterium]